MSTTLDTPVDSYRFPSESAMREALTFLHDEKDLQGFVCDSRGCEILLDQRHALVAETIFRREQVQFKKHPLGA